MLKILITIFLIFKIEKCYFDLNYLKPYLILKLIKF